jgi:preprotein translocase subunit SecE
MSVSQTSTDDARRRGGAPRARVGVALFIRQVIAELRKVVRPTRNELVTYTGAAMVFVAAIMAFVFVLDLISGKLVLWVFSAG